MLKDNIQRLRKEVGLTQAQLGIKIGSNEHAVGNWERGSCTPNPEMIVKLKHALNCTYEELLEGA